MTRHAVLIAVMLALTCPLAALADDASVGLSLAPLLGRHEESGLTSQSASIPIPILQVRGRRGSVELFAEGLPVSLPIDERGSVQSFSTRLTFFDAILRAYARDDRFSAGVGTLVYDQTTSYTPSSVIDASRVAGARYEIGIGLLRDARRLRLLIDLMPNMQGDVHQHLPARGSGEVKSVEAGSQVELELQVLNERGPLRFEYGARYVNYVTKFTRDGTLADRNVGLLPFITFVYRIGRP